MGRKRRGSGTLYLEEVAAGTLMSSDGRPVLAVSTYAAQPSDGRPLLTASLSTPTDGSPIYPASFYAAGTLATPDGRPVYAVTAAGGVEAPVLAWTSGTTDRDPDFTITGVEVDDVVTLEIATDAGFTSIFDSDTNTVDVTEAADGELTFPGISQLAYSTTYWARCKITRDGEDSDWSNVETKTMDAAPLATWDAANKSADITLSSGNTVFTGTDGVRGTARTTTAVAQNNPAELAITTGTYTTNKTIFVGIGDSATTFGGEPGRGSVTGISLTIGDWGWEVWRGNSAVAFSYVARPFTTGSVAKVVTDGAGNASFYDGATLLTTQALPSLTGDLYGFGGADWSNSGTIIATNWN